MQEKTRLFVSEIRSETNEVMLDVFDALYKSQNFLSEIHFSCLNRINRDNLYKVRIRYRLQENNCHLRLFSGDKAVVELLEPVAMVAYWPDNCNI